MSPEARRIAIAQVCGWYIHDAACPAGVQMWTHSKHPYGWRATSGLPDYLNSLNAMHEAEKVLTGKQATEYANAVISICDRDSSRDCKWGATTFFILHASASQRAEAFLRCIGKLAD